MKNIKTLSLLLLAVIFAGCGSSNVQTVKTTEKDLGSYDSFAYLPNSTPEGMNQNYNDEAVNTAVIEVVNSKMKEAGYKLDRDNPDLLVLISTKTNTETGTTTEPLYAGYPYTTGVTSVRSFYNPYYYRGFNTVNRVVGYDTDTFQYKEGTLVINLVDRETQETVWKGIASDNIYNQGTNSAIRTLVNDIFEEYPLMMN